MTQVIRPALAGRMTWDLRPIKPAYGLRLGGFLKGLDQEKTAEQILAHGHDPVVTQDRDAVFPQSAYRRRQVGYHWGKLLNRLQFAEPEFGFKNPRAESIVLQ